MALGGRVVSVMNDLVERSEYLSPEGTNADVASRPMVSFFDNWKGAHHCRISAGTLTFNVEEQEPLTHQSQSLPCLALIASCQRTHSFNTCNGGCAL